MAQEIGTKKWVFSGDMGLPEYYGPGERRCERPAQEWSLDKQMQRKIRVADLEDRRNGIGQANPGDKGYGTAEHAPEYAEMLLNENRGRGNLQRKVMSKIDKSWSQSGADALLDKHGRRMSDYIQVYCKTPYRKNSMYVHRDAGVQEIADMASEGGSKKMQIWFKGRACPARSHLLELGVRAKSTLELVTYEEPLQKLPTFKEKTMKMTMLEEEHGVASLNELNLEDKFPASEREEYKEEGEEEEEEA